MRGRVTDSSRHRPAIFHEPDRRAEFRDALHKFARAIERIDDPNPALAQTRNIVGAFFRKPAFPIPQQILAKHFIDGAVRLGDRIMSDLVLSFYRSRCKTCEYGASGFEGGRDALQDVGICGSSHLYECVLREIKPTTCGLR